MPPQTFGPNFKAACALLSTRSARGTGFLVSAEHLLTCYHLIQSTDDEPIQARFSHGRYEAKVELVDVQNDCALLLLNQSVPGSEAQPLTISTVPAPRGAKWEGYGYPAATGQAGLLIDGRVQDPAGQDQTLRPTVVLQSDNVTAGSWLSGFSGSPVLVEGKVIGQLRRIIPDESGGAQMAVVYACPANILAALARRRQVTGALQGTNPYRGLAAFLPEDSSLFFGREALTEKLWLKFQSLGERPAQTRLMAVLGPSGSGKSSAVLAGLVPALRAQLVCGPLPPRIVLLKPGYHPIESLARALVPLLPPDLTVLPANRALAIEQLLRSPSASTEGLRRFATELHAIDQVPLVVVVDQFEEIYTLCTDRTDRDAFVEMLLYAARALDGHVAVVLTLRSDFLGETHRQHPELNRLIGDHTVLVPAMSTEELRQAIARPAEQIGRPIDDATIELLLTQSRENDGSLPMLEFSLFRIWAGMLAGKEPGETLREVGGVGGALAHKAQEIYEALSEREQAIARRALVRLVQLGEGTRDTRRRVSIPELCGHGETEVEVLSVLRRFASDTARLVTLSGDEVEAVAEVTHEALFDHWTDLRLWIDTNRADRRFHDRVTEAARLWNIDRRPPGRLWRTPDLDLLRDYEKRKPEEMSPLLTAFLNEAERQARHDTRRTWGAVIAVLTAVLIAAGTYAVKERQRLHEGILSQDELSRTMAAKAYSAAYLASVAADPLRALLLSSRAVALTPTDDPRLSAYLARTLHLSELAPQRLIYAEIEPRSAFLSPNLNLALMSTVDGKLYAVRLSDGKATQLRPAGTDTHRRLPRRIVFSRDSKQVAGLFPQGEDAVLQVFDTISGAENLAVPVLRKDSMGEIPFFTATGRPVLMSLKEDKVHIQRWPSGVAKAPEWECWINPAKTPIKFTGEVIFPHDSGQPWWLGKSEMDSAQASILPNQESLVSLPEALDSDLCLGPSPDQVRVLNSSNLFVSGDHRLSILTHTIHTDKDHGVEVQLWDLARKKIIGNPVFHERTLINSSPREPSIKIDINIRGLPHRSTLNQERDAQGSKDQRGTGKLVSKEQQPHESCRCRDILDISGDGKTVLVKGDSGSDNFRIFYIRTSDGDVDASKGIQVEQGWALHIPAAEYEWMLKLNYDGSVLTTISRAGEIRFWNTGEDHSSSEPIVLRDRLLTAQISEDRRMLRVMDVMGRVYQWDTSWRSCVANPRRIFSSSLGSQAYVAGQLSPNRDRLALISRQDETNMLSFHDILTGGIRWKQSLDGKSSEVPPGVDLILRSRA